MEKIVRYVTLNDPKSLETKKNIVFYEKDDKVKASIGKNSFSINELFEEASKSYEAGNDFETLVFTDEKEFNKYLEAAEEIRRKNFGGFVGKLACGAAILALAGCTINSMNNNASKTSADTYTETDDNSEASKNVATLYGAQENCINALSNFIGSFNTKVDELKLSEDWKLSGMEAFASYFYFNDLTADEMYDILPLIQAQEGDLFGSLPSSEELVKYRMSAQQKMGRLVFAFDSADDYEIFEDLVTGDKATRALENIMPYLTSSDHSLEEVANALLLNADNTFTTQVLSWATGMKYPGLDDVVVATTKDQKTLKEVNVTFRDEMNRKGSNLCGELEGEISEVINDFKVDNDKSKISRANFNFTDNNREYEFQLNALIRAYNYEPMSEDKVQKLMNLELQSQGIVDTSTKGNAGGYGGSGGESPTKEVKEVKEEANVVIEDNSSEFGEDVVTKDKGQELIEKETKNPVDEAKEKAEEAKNNGDDVEVKENGNEVIIDNKTTGETITITTDIDGGKTTIKEEGAYVEEIPVDTPDKPHEALDENNWISKLSQQAANESKDSNNGGEIEVEVGEIETVDVRPYIEVPTDPTIKTQNVEEVTSYSSSNEEEDYGVVLSVEVGDIEYVENDTEKLADKIVSEMANPSNTEEDAKVLQKK